MALESETDDTREAAALQLTAADRARLVDRLIATLDAEPEVEEAWAAKWSAGKPKSKMELFLYCPVRKTLTKLKAVFE
jgi:putative addiction module component